MFNVSTRPETGGAVYHLQVYRYLQEFGADVRNITLPQDIPWLPLPVRLILANYFVLKRFSRLKLGDCILFEDCYSHLRFLLTNWWARIHGIKIVLLMQFNIYQDHYLLRRPFWRFVDHLILRYFLRQGDVILANSEQSMHDVLMLGCPKDKVKVVYCGVDIQLDSEVTYRSYELDGEKFRLLFVGSVIERKGLCYLLHALSELTDLRFELDVVGNTEDEPEYVCEMKKLIGNYGFGEVVIFHGHIADREQLRQLYRSADIFVLPSLYETFGIVLLEAMSFGLPILTTRAGAIPELIKDGETGLLVPPGNKIALAHAIRQLAASPELRCRLGQNGFSFISEHQKFYSWETVCKRIYTILCNMGK